MSEKETCPLSTAQQEVYLAIAQAGSNKNYHLCDIIEFRGQLQLPLLEQAINTVCGKTAALHTVFEIDPTSSQCVQYFLPNTPLSFLEWHDFSEIPDPEQAYTALLNELLSQDIDLSQAPLGRYVLIKLAENFYRMIELGPHLVMDGYGHSILFSNIADYYGRLLRGETVAPLPMSPLKSVVEAEQEYYASNVYVKDQAYWRKYCLKMPDATQLVPGDAPLVTLNRLRKIFTGKTLDRLRATVSEHQLRLSSVLLALCATYLHKMTGQTELAVGMPVAARKLKALRTIPSMVSNILPLHLSFTTESTVFSVAINIQHQLRHHLLHQSYRSETMIRDLQAERGHKPLFNTLLNIQSYDRDIRFDNCEMTVVNVANGPARHLNINIFERNNSYLEIGFDANADLYTPEALEQHYQRLILLLEHFVNMPDTPAADYDLLLPGERERFYPLPIAGDPQPTFRDAFADTVHAHAEQIALLQDDRALSYAQLDNYATRLAGRLRALGVCPGSDVAVVTSRSIEWVVAAVALFKLGACYIPVVPDLPEARIEYILNDAAPAMVIITGDSAINIPVPQEKRLFLTTEMLENLPLADRPLADFDSGTSAYMIYTSGSTGKPKGVEVTHRNLEPIARTAIEAAGLQPGQRVLQFIAAGFDMSVLEIMMTLLAGATLTIADKVSTTPGKPLATLVRRENIRLLVLTPSLLAYHETEDFPQGTVLLLGGEPCPPALLARFSHCRLLNVYGPTETSFATSINAHYGTGDFSIGTATANTRLYVVDKQQRLLPPGSWGELFIGGPGVARGYRNRPDLTAKGFVPDLLDAAANMYRSGDSVFFDHVGRLFYQGRKDSQIKLRGLRIELGEIKNALLGCSGVEDAVAMLCNLAHGPAIVAYVANSRGELDCDCVKKALSRQLPQHMLPSIIMVVPSFPLTPNGKLATRELPPPVQQDDNELIPPRTPEEKIICRLFESILECETVYANQNFFTLGGHSLLGLQLIGRIREEFGVSLSISDFLTAPTPRQLAQHLKPADCLDDPFDAILPLRTKGARPPLFCIHPGGGIAWSFAGLLPFLPEDQPVYAIQSPILRDPRRVIHSLDELAKEYLQHIRTIQPQGPYHLTGWSVGGNIALRIATMLQAEGQEVRFLCMFDSYPLQNGQDSLKLDDATVITRMTRAIAGAPRSGIKGLKSAMAEALGNDNIGEEFLTRLVKDAKLMLKLLTECRYTAYDGDLVFIRATSDILRAKDQQPALWLQYISGELIEYEVEAPHECMLQRQYLEQFGRQFAAELLKRQTDAALAP
ncbi:MULTISPECIES: non-ribosomal peptide synthetase [unclassified Brenneria]|uniref:non-ribosomal peptide synthetase n=1 Tax=unclassified Brenneria TaxID=2634434 RepID=UPI0015557B4D|nr:non-ribosomal peptide synthetase [Brenneria sp. hezel4-2-4]MEE3651211.1 non-ribosomal peptide synthetase [Brenneria sp. HEZEL_4_2_4]NPD01167.1 amino acid adenylation domain-containing protein [Brenneria sp. hezel4-2-4]